MIKKIILLLLLINLLAFPGYATTFYLDYENGADANDGSTWALAWKTITSGATAARIAPGDIIRIAKSPAPASLGTTGIWTDLSKTVTLGAAQTATVNLCEAM